MRGEEPRRSEPPDKPLGSIDDIPHETLILLCKKKDRELTICQEKLKRVEDKLVSEKTHKKVLLADRKNFARFAAQVVSEVDSAALFEHAAAQTQPVDIAALEQRLQEAAPRTEKESQARNSLRIFADLIFPEDGEVEKACFAEPINMDLLRRKWGKYEDQQGEAIASVSVAAKERVESYEKQLAVVENEKKQLQRKLESVHEELTAKAEEVADAQKQLAQLYASRMLGRGGSPPPKTNFGGGAKSNGVDELAQAKAQLQEQESRIRELEATAEEHATCAAKILGLEEAVGQLSSEVDSACSAKDKVIADLQLRLDAVLKEQDESAFIGELAARQAEREVEIGKLQSRIADLNQQLEEADDMRAMAAEQEKVLKQHIRELEGSTGRSEVNLDYLKHVVLKYMVYVKNGDSKASSLVPVIGTVLALSPEERETVEGDSWSVFGLLRSFSGTDLGKSTDSSRLPTIS
mmetsp:Transcript_136460/g.308376  ORF Transcript_136460/g.308376 Transcript_136460/m.308376 type:complete len:465 (+) Transcript_136460:20-1414(+)